MVSLNAMVRGGGVVSPADEAGHGTTSEPVVDSLWKSGLAFSELVRKLEDALDR